MPKRTLTVFSLIAQSWKFMRKHPVLVSVLLWILVVPLSAASLLPELLPLQDERHLQAAEMTVLILMLFIGSWGTASVLLVGRRMIQSKAGRARSSLKSVLEEAVPWVLPFILTSALQTCFIFYRALLFLVPAAALLLLPSSCADGDCSISWLYFLPLLPLLIPAVVYTVRTALFPVALFADDRRYRAALERSRELTRGRFWHVFGSVLPLSLLLVVLPNLLGFLLEAQGSRGPLPVTVFTTVMGVAIGELGLMLFTLSLIPLYGRLRDGRGKEVKAPF